jgi:hypothetical protein
MYKHVLVSCYGHILLETLPPGAPEVSTDPASTSEEVVLRAVQVCLSI